MKRFAAHYIYLPEDGFLKQYVVETAFNGSVSDFFSLGEEMESVEWFPGVIGLCAENQIHSFGHGLQGYHDYFQLTNRVDLCNLCLKPYNKEILFPVLFYPFDFILMQPAAGTRHRLLP